jgi:hypothetical protein
LRHPAAPLKRNRGATSAVGIWRELAEKGR